MRKVLRDIGLGLVAVIAITAVFALVDLRRTTVKTRYVIFSGVIGEAVTCDYYRLNTCGVSISGCDSGVDFDCLQSVAKIKIKQ